MAWFVNPRFFILETAGVVLMLYRREFHSDVLQVMSSPQAPALEVNKDKSA
jgi:uncharacterized membrane protein